MHRTDEAGDAGRERRIVATVLEIGQQVQADGNRGEGRQPEGGHQPAKRGLPQRLAEGHAGRRCPRCLGRLLQGPTIGAEAEVFRPSSQHQRVRRNRPNRQDDRQGHQRWTPPVDLHEPACQRDEDRAGESSHERDDGQRADAIAFEPPGGGGKSRIVEGGRHRHSDRRPEHVQLLDPVYA